MHVLEFASITKRYGSTAVVEDLSFAVQPGRVTGFLGPNGAGKSTTMKILLDLAAADEGRATIGGQRYRDLREPTRTVGVVLEPNAFHPARTGRNHLRILADRADVAPSRIEELLRLVGLADAADRKVGAYSLGMRQRLGLAAALLGDPPVLVLDEPGNGLDPQGIRWLRDLLRLRAANGNTVFVSSHLLSEVEHLADEVVIIDRGRLVTTGSIAELQEADIRVRTADPEQFAGVLEDAGATVGTSIDGALLVRGLATTEVGELARDAGVALHWLAQESGSLEEIFLASTDHVEPHDDRSKEVTRR